MSVAMLYPELSSDRLQEVQVDFSVLSFTEVARKGCLPFALNDQIGVAVADIGDATLLNWIDYRFGLAGKPYQIYTASAVLIREALAHEEDRLRAAETFRFESAGDAPLVDGGEGLSLRSIGEDTSPIVRLVNSTLYDAWKSGASDIHLETMEMGLVVKYRLDGVLVEIQRVNGITQADQVVSRIKVMSDLDISERRVPQDGRFRSLILGRNIDFRVSVMPSVYGEDIVLRMLDKRHLSDTENTITLERLGFAAEDQVLIRRLAREPYGMMLVTGPTGSGKTTTLYAMLTEINDGSDKIITIEDPVEYQLQGVLQIPVNEKKGLTFARGLRSILRHDPDKILIGEIRDSETAQIAIQSALTGHLVFTTVHANNVFDVIGRFTHMDIDMHSFVAALNGVVAQRLVRMNCTHCTATETISDDVLAYSGLPKDAVATWNFQKGMGCEVCRGTGYKGRQAIAEILLMDDELRELIAQRSGIRKIKEAAAARGTRLLRQSCLGMVRAGKTSLEELNRVTSVSAH